MLENVLVGQSALHDAEWRGCCEVKMTILDDLYGALLRGGDAEGRGFYRALADAELFLLLEAEAAGEVMTPRAFDLAQGPVLLAFDSEERLAGFGNGAVAYAALPGRVIAAQMAGQGLSLGLNLGSGAASEVILPPEALAWLMQMLDQKAPEPWAAKVAGFATPTVSESVSAALASILLAGMRGYLADVRYTGGLQGQMLVLTGVDAASEVRVARAVTEALAFSGVEAGALDVAFVTPEDPALARMAGVAQVFEGAAAVVAEPLRRDGPGMDKARPPMLR